MAGLYHKILGRHPWKGWGSTQVAHGATDARRLAFRCVARRARRIGDGRCGWYLCATKIWAMARLYHKIHPRQGLVLVRD